MVAHGVVPVAVVGIVGVVPVDQGEVEAHPQALGPECLYEVPDDIPAQLGVGGLEVGILTVEEAEAVVVLGGQDHVLHAGLLGGLGPGPGVVVPGVELVEVGHVLGFGHLLVTAHPLAPGGDAVQAPVDKHAEPGLAKPLHSCLIGAAIKGKHRDLPIQSRRL